MRIEKNTLKFWIYLDKKFYRNPKKIKFIQILSPLKKSFISNAFPKKDISKST